MRFHLIFVALLYGLMTVSANAAELSAEDRAEITRLAEGEMAKLVVHDEPRARMNEIFLDEAGEEMRLADLEGRVVLLNLWATWCPPCRAEMPSIDRLAGEMAGPETGLAVIALSSDRDGAKRIKRFYEEVGIGNLGIYQDPRGKMSTAAGAIGLPVTLILDREGNEIARVTGDAEWDSDEAKAVLAKLVELTAPAGQESD